ncbi:MAG: carbohydrate-binding module family 20 domain-containing protein [Parachlamydiales bacterium]
MSLSNISDQLRSLQGQIISFVDECDGSISILVPRSEVTVSLAEPSYERAQQAYERISMELANIRTRITDRHYYNTLEVATDPDYLTNTDLVETLDNANRVFTDRFVTHYPDAQINYGRKCVSPREKWSVQDLTKQDAFAPYRSKFPNFRAIRGDGNCFFSGVTVGMLEHFVKTNQVDTLLQTILDHPEWDSPGREVVVQLLMELADTPSMLEARLQNNQKVLCCTNLFRHIAAAHMKANREEFEPFLEKPFDTYINETVLKMGENAEHCAIIALCKALNFPVVIHDIGVDTNDKGTHLGYDHQPALATLCRNGEHYFVFYADDTLPSSPHISGSSAASSSYYHSFAPTTSLIFALEAPPGVTIELRGKGPGMHDWSVGVPLQNLGANIYSWTSEQSFEPFVYKIVGRTKTGELLWESGPDRIMKVGASDVIDPRLTLPSIPKSQVTVQFTPPPGITLELRGKGPGMHDWSVGIPLKQGEGNTWSWNYDQTFEPFVYKIVGRTLKGDLVWESGDDRTMRTGSTEAIVPKLDFSSAPTALLTVQCAPKPDMTLELRGRGPGMGEWSNGIPLKHTEGDNWSFEMTESFEPFEYKIVGRRSNGDLVWESGDNRIMKAGQSDTIQARL